MSRISPALLALSLASCADPWQELSEGPPAAGAARSRRLEGLHLARAELVAGSPTAVHLYGAEPGETVHLLRGAALGAGPCPAALGGQCLDLARPRPVVEGPLDLQQRPDRLPTLRGLTLERGVRLRHGGFELGHLVIRGPSAGIELLSRDVGGSTATLLVDSCDVSGTTEAVSVANEFVRRVRSAVWTLRRLGLRDRLRSTPEGYRLIPPGESASNRLDPEGWDPGGSPAY